MIHECLRVPEVFGLICEALQQDWALSKEPYNRSPTLAVLARTCRDFEGPALDVLWREVSGLRPLLCTMPSDLFEMKKKENMLCLRRAILPSDLEKTPSYATRIRKLWMASISPVDVGVVQALSLATLHMKPLLPNIRHLLWSDELTSIEVKRLMLHCIPLFLAPKLVSLSIALDSVPDTITLSIFSSLVNFCPALKELKFPINDENFNEEQRRTISSAICQWKDLQSVMVTDLTEEALEHLATIPSLQKLSFHSLSGATRTYDEDHSIAIRNCARGYPALQFLSISCRTMEMAIAFVQLLSSSPIEELNIQVENCRYPSAWEELFRTISRHLNSTSLKRLILEETGDNLGDSQSVHSGIELGALTVFSNVRMVHVQPSFGIPLTSDTANRLAVAWPHIEELQLGTEYPPSKTIITARDLIPFARYCPNLQCLGIVFDARSGSLEPDSGPFSNNLTSLSVGNSPIDDPNSVAAFLSSIFPIIDSVDTGSEDEIVDEMWMEVQRMLDIFQGDEYQETLQKFLRFIRDR